MVELKIFLPSTCLAAFFAQLHEVDVKPPGSTLLLIVLAFWCVFVMHNATRIKKTGQHHFHLAPNLPSFFGSW